MKNLSKLFSVLLFLLVVLVWVPVAEAHVLKTDGSIGAVIHINPDDDPVVGEPASFFFDLKDKDSKFSAEKCDCRAMVSMGEMEMFSQGLFASNDHASLNAQSFSYTFPEKGIYTVVVSGKPYLEGDFQPFTLKYDIRVSRESAGATHAMPTESSSGDVYRYLFIGGVVIVFLLIVLGGKFKSAKKLVLILLIGLSVTAFNFCFHSKILMAQHGSQDQHQTHSQSTDHPCCIQQYIGEGSAVSVGVPLIYVSQHIEYEHSLYLAFYIKYTQDRSPPASFS